MAFTAPGLLLAQSGGTGPRTQNRFPYLFSNFPWWSDSALRTDLKKRIPGLGDELIENSQMEARVRTTLTQLLREKGIHAQVMTEEPSENLLSAPRDPNAPPTSIIFSVLPPPEILVEKLNIENLPSDAGGVLTQTASRAQGQPYAENSLWSYKEEMQEALRETGYLGSTVTLKHGSPKEEKNQYLVTIEAAVESGPKYHIAALTADGGPLLKGRDLSPYFALKPGDVATPNPFGRRLTGTLISIYWRAGYPDVQLHAPSILDSQHALASYHLEVIPGPLYHLRGLKVEGLSGSQQAEALAMLGLKSGDVYNGYAVAMLDRKLSAAASPLKSYGVSFTPKEDKQNHVVDLTLHFHKQ
jgi:outer membrane protein assembly factor BamA